MEENAFQTPELKTLLKVVNRLDHEAVATALQQEGMFNIIDNESVFKIDFIIKKSDPFSLEQFKRRQRKKLGLEKIEVISPEDLVLAKLVWARQTASALQEKDIRNVLQVLGASLDFAYLEKWAETLGIVQKLRSLYDRHS